MAEPRTKAGKAHLDALLDAIENEWGMDDATRESQTAEVVAIETEAGELDSAWAEAEAALPEGWQIITLEWAGTITDYLGEPTPEDGEDWRAIADALGKEDEDEAEEIRYARGPSPAAALRALATKLRERIAAE